MTLTWDVEGCFPPTAYVPNAHTKGLWHLEANSNDSSGNAKHGTDTNIAYAAAKIGNGAHWTVGDGGISIPANTMGTIGLGDFAMASWFYGANPGAGNFPCIMESFELVAPYKGPIIFYDPLGVGMAGDGIIFSLDYNTNKKKVTTPSASSLYGKWTHIVFTRISGVCYVYYDGKLVLSFAEATNIPAATANYVNINGRIATATRAWKSGLIGDEYIWEDQGWTLPMVQEAYGWKTVKSDCVLNRPVTAKHGIPGIKPTDRLGTTGSLSFTLRNDSENSGGLEGYYSPGHANCREGFGQGTLFRFKISNGTNTKYLLRSKARKIEPLSNKYGDKTVGVVCYDYFDDLAMAPLQQIPVQANTYINLAVDTVLGFMAIPPCNTSGILSPNGPEAYERLLYGMMDNKSSIITALQRLCQTDSSYLFLVGDSTDGETMKWQSRHDRNLDTIEAIFSDTMVDLRAGNDPSLLYNNVTTVAHPSSSDDTEVILAQTDAKEFQLAPGAANAVTMTLKFTDPEQLGRQVDMVYGSQPVGWPVAGTDFKMSSVAGNGGTDLNGFLDIDVVWGGNSAVVTFTNTGTAIGYISLFHIRGLGIYDYNPIEKTHVDQTSQDAHNNRPFRLDMFYCDYDRQADSFAIAILADGKDPRTVIKSLTFIASDLNHPEFADYAVDLDTGSCISVVESMTGVDGDFFIQGIALECSGDVVRVKLENLQPANTNLPFRLCEEDDDVENPATSILAEYDEESPDFTLVNPYGNEFHRLYY